MPQNCLIHHLKFEFSCDLKSDKLVLFRNICHTLSYRPLVDLFLIPLLAACIAAITLLSGFGLGTVLMPVFALFFPIEIAIAATGVVHLANNLFKLALVGKWADRTVALRFGIPAVIAAFVGAALLSLLTPAAPIHSYSLDWFSSGPGHTGGHTATITPAKLITAAILAIFATLELTPAYQRLALPQKFLSLGGFLSGFFGGLTGMQGALRAPFLLRANLTKDQFVGTTNVVSTAVDLTRLLVYALGFTYLAKVKDYSVLTEPRTITLVTLTAAAGCVGSLLGKRFLRNITLRTVRTLVATLLFLLAALLASGIA